jgi:hypothetical protein
METKFEWKDTAVNSSTVCYYFESHSGKIVGQVNNIVHTDVWISKIILNYNEERFLGMFITNEHAKAAISNYWLIQSRTLLE